MTKIHNNEDLNKNSGAKKQVKAQMTEKENRNFKFKKSLSII